MSTGCERQAGTGDLEPVLTTRKQSGLAAKVPVVGSHEADGGAPVLSIVPGHEALYPWVQAGPGHIAAHMSIL